MKRILLLAAVLLLEKNFSFSQDCDPGNLQQYIISAHETDINIPVEPQKHYAFINTSCPPKNVLIVYLVGTGANPSGTLYFPKLAANNGFHVVSLKYPNSLSAQVPCRNSPDEDCYEDFRKEILEGIDYSPAVTVDATNCVYNRLIKLLIYLNDHYPTQGWDQFYDGSNFLWDHIMVAGHSQGGGHVAVIAKDHEVKRVLMFASPNDYSDFFGGPALWTTKPHVTPGNLYYAFGNTTDEIVDFNEQLQQWDALGLDDFGDTLFVGSNVPPYSYTHQLYTSYDPSGNSGNHNSVVVDAWTPLATGGSPEFEPVWKYMLGVNNPKSVQVSGTGFSLNGIPLISGLRSGGYFNSSSALPCSCLIYDFCGRLVERFYWKPSDNSSLDNLNLPAGIYFYQLLDDDGVQTGAGKFMVEGHFITQ